LRGLTNLANASATVGGQTAVVDYAGQVTGLVGLDQVNLTLPQSLRGQGTVPISLTLDGKTANTLNIVMAGAVSAPALTSISPTSGQAGQTINNFTINGSNLTGGQVIWDNSAGLTLSNVSVGAASITATLAIASNAATGARSVWVTNSAGASNQLSFNITPAPAPAITSISPTSGQVGQTIATFKVNGTNLSGVTTIEFTPSTGITVSSLTANSTTVTAQVAIALSAATGSRTVDVVSGAGRSNTVTFTVNPGGSTIPTISNVNVTGPTLSTGNVATVSGSFSFTDGGGDILFTGALAGSAKVQLSIMGQCTISSTGVFLNMPGQTSGTITLNITYPANSLTVGTGSNYISLFDAAGNQSNQVAFSSGLGYCP
jgi:hypothetical protein